VARDRVDVAGDEAGPKRVQRRELRLEAYAVGVLQLRRERPGRERARAVRVVAVEHAAGVDDHRLPRLDPPVAGMRVRGRAGRAGRDDRREGRAVPAELVEELLHPPRELALGPPDERLARNALEGPARDRRGPSDRVELGLVLHGTEPLDEAAPRDEVDAGRAEELVARIREVLPLEADAAGEEAGEPGVERALRLDELDPLDGAPGHGVAEVGEEPDALSIDDERGVCALEAAQVADVRRLGDEERLLQSRLQPFDAVAHRPTRNSSASR